MTTQKTDFRINSEAKLCPEIERYIEVSTSIKNVFFSYSKKGFTPQHDDMYTSGELAFAAASYALESQGVSSNFIWPEYWKRAQLSGKTPYELLAASASLCMVEMMRLKRLEEEAKKS